MISSGQLIVIEGTDGSGKGTQSKLLVERLKKNDSPSTMFSVEAATLSARLRGLGQELQTDSEFVRKN
mgnify:CR=1 FL=1